MKRLSLIFGAVLLCGVIFTIYNQAQIHDWPKAAILGASAGLLLVSAIVIVQQTLAGKIDIYSPGQQWFLRAIFYTIAIVCALLISLFIRANLLQAETPLSAGIIEFLWNATVDILQNQEKPVSIANFVHPDAQRFVLMFVALILLISFASILGSRIEVRWQEERHKRAREQAELTALRAQMDPHFLFNALNTIISRLKSEPELAEKLLIQLSDLMRYVFQNSGTQQVPLREEIQFNKLYLDLLQARFPENLHVRWQLELEDDMVSAPAFLLQPIIENAVRHAWKDQSQPLNLAVEAKTETGYILMKITDNGQGIPPAMQDKVFNSDHALANLKERLNLIYNQKAHLEINSTWGAGTTVEIGIPITK